MQAISVGYQNYNGVPFSSNTFRPHSSSHNLGSGNQEGDEQVQHFAIGTGGLFAASLLLEKLSKILAFKMSSGKEFTSAENVDKVANQMLTENKLDKTVNKLYINHQNKNIFADNWAKELEVVANGQNAFYSDSVQLKNGKSVKLAVAPETKPSLILHELGHAINSSKGPFMQFLQKSRRWATFAPMALMGANALMGNHNDGKENFVERNAGLLGFSAFLPTIIEEGMASWRGIKAAKVAKEAGKLAGSVNLGALKRNYALALGTYILAGIGLGLTSKQLMMEKRNGESRGFMA